MGFPVQRLTYIFWWVALGAAQGALVCGGVMQKAALLCAAFPEQDLQRGHHFCLALPAMGSLHLGWHLEPLISGSFHFNF